ncbi:hypothetical protein VAEKB19_4210088 [Vibrio aestuarianus]|nr:hypothetical protein VAEKB19_4210088 [Vibrio aestuarianus]
MNVKAPAGAFLLVAYLFYFYDYLSISWNELKTLKSGCILVLLLVDSRHC